MKTGKEPKITYSKLSCNEERAKAQRSEAAGSVTRVEREYRV